jgi:dolichol-phosphate mannosyltransferase
MTGGQPATLIVIPTYNERDLVSQIVPAVRAVVPEAAILVVDDNSPDGTGQVADALAAQDPNVRVLHRPGKQGLGAAYLDAFQRALAPENPWRRIVQMDADFSHDPADIPRLLRALDEGADLAIGSRYTQGGGTENWGLSRRLISRGGGLYARLVLGVGIQDLTSGFKAWRIETLRAFDLGAVSARGYGFQIEMTYRALRAGLRVAEVPIKFVDRRVGESKMSGTIFFEALTLVWSLRARIPRTSGSGRAAVL